MSGGFYSRVFSPRGRTGWRPAACVVGHSVLITQESLGDFLHTPYLFLENMRANGCRVFHTERSPRRGELNCTEDPPRGLCLKVGTGPSPSLRGCHSWNTHSVPRHRAAPPPTPQELCEEGSTETEILGGSERCSDLRRVTQRANGRGSRLFSGPRGDL